MSSSSSPAQKKVSGGKPLSEVEAKETRHYLEQSQLPALLEDFTLEVAKHRPKDVVAFMSSWAQQRSQRNVLSHSNHLTKSLEGSPKKPVLLALLGLEDRDDVLEDLDVNEEERSSHLKNHVKAARAQLKAACIQSYTLAALESDTYTFILVNLELAEAPLAPSPILLNLLSLCDGLVLKVSCEGTAAAKDLKKRRQGVLYHQVLSAHACQVKNALVLLTNYRSADEKVVRDTIEETETCLYTSGYKKDSVPILRLPSDEASSRAELAAMASTLPFVLPRRKPRYYDHAKQIEAKVMVLDGDGLSVGESMAAFCKTGFHCRVDAVPAVLDKSTGQVKEKKPFQIKCGDAGLVSLSMVQGAEVVKDAPIVLTRGTRIAAFGHITLVVTEEETDEGSTEEFDLSDG